MSAFTQGSDLDVAGAIGAMMCAVMPEGVDVGNLAQTSLTGFATPLLPH